MCLPAFLALIAAVPTLDVTPPAVRLTGPGATWSLLASTTRADGQRLDRTHAAIYATSNAGIARVDARGRVSGVTDGKASIRVAFDGVHRDIPIEVTGSHSKRYYHFVNDLLPLLSRHACNSSGCHGKAEGQNGFKLSVFGFDPPADLASIVSEGRGRRVLPASPENSLFVRKMSGLMPHGGGARIRPNTADYDTVVGWIAAGTPMGSAEAPETTAIRVEPAEGVLDARATQQLRVIATDGVGAERDVTDHARFYSNNESLATADADGRVRAGGVPGEAAVMASYMNRQAVFRVLVPRSPRIANYPRLPEANVVDTHVNARLRKLHILPSGVCDDATFMRRAHLDVIGTLPTPAEVRAFLGDARADKRTRLVDALLARPEYADYRAMKWADLLRVDRAVLGAKQARAYHAWIRSRVAADEPMDVFARKILTADGPLGESPQGTFYKAVRKPGEMAGTLAQVFMGVRIACAECHHHPFDVWSQTDYQGMAGYFTGLQVAKESVGDSVSVKGSASGIHPRTKATIPAYPLGGRPGETPGQGDRRGELADAMTSASNRWFARNLANRLWAEFMGRGLIEPVDDVRDTNPPSNPELLDALAAHLVANRFDAKALVRLIASSNAYQRETAPNDTNADDHINHSRGPLRRLPAEVLLDMVSQATGVAERFKGFPDHTRAVALWDSKVDHYFLKSYGRPERASACECERNAEPSVAQVLHLLNAPEIEAKISHAGGSVARLVRKVPDDGRLVEELYVTYLSRLPTAVESKKACEHLRRGASRRQAAEDLAWAMMNTLEFVFNH